MNQKIDVHCIYLLYPCFLHQNTRTHAVLNILHSDALPSVLNGACSSQVSSSALCRWRHIIHNHLAAFYFTGNHWRLRGRYRPSGRSARHLLFHTSTIRFVRIKSPVHIIQRRLHVACPSAWPMFPLQISSKSQYRIYFLFFSALSFSALATSSFCNCIGAGL